MSVVVVVVYYAGLRPETHKVLNFYSSTFLNATFLDAIFLVL